MAAGAEQRVFSFGDHSYDVDKMYQRYLSGGCSNPDELDDDVFHPEDFIFPDQPGDKSLSSVFTQMQSYTGFLGRFQLFPLSHCCGPGVKQTDHEDKATQTQSPPSPSDDIMLPCGVTAEPQRLFYGSQNTITLEAILGWLDDHSTTSEVILLSSDIIKLLGPDYELVGNAGYRLHFPGNLQRNLNPRVRPAREQQVMTAEVQIARKLQRIGDQFHRRHLQMGQENRNHVWWRILFFFRNLP